mgnify:CR=1 FL=1
MAFFKEVRDFRGQGVDENRFIHAVNFNCFILIAQPCYDTNLRGTQPQKLSYELDTGFIDTFNNQIWAFIALKKLRLVEKLQKGRNGNMNGA